uniref:6-phosphogluconate dehydrogenase NADP-binding domain-containing protein n=1 Tax=Arundo donax TaxID=35708 RepID=A0A0A9CYS1_ARUDO
MYLGVRAGIHPSIIYDIISNAAGSLRIFVELVPKLLSEDPSLINFLNSSKKNASHVMDMVKAVTFPLPLLAVAYQQFIHGSSTVNGGGSASPLKVWEESFGVKIIDAASQQIYDASKLADQLVMESKTAKQIGFIGLGAMGFGMASHLLKSGFSVVAYDVYKPTMARFADLGGSTKSSPEEVAKDVEILIIMVANEFQADSVLYGNAGAVPVCHSIFYSFSWIYGPPQQKIRS